jgi:hypothetical protein
MLSYTLRSPYFGSATDLIEMARRELDNANLHVRGGIPMESKVHLASMVATVASLVKPQPWRHASVVEVLPKYRKR